MAESGSRTAIVTGGGMGIGREIALALARGRFNVAIADISDKGTDTQKEIRKMGGESIAVRCDVSSRTDVENAVRSVKEKWGAVKVQVNNAGIYPQKPFMEMTEADFDRVLNIKLKSVFLFSKAVLQGMMERKVGKIVNLPSIAGSVVGFPGLVHHSASKAAVMGLTRALALEMAPNGIKVNCVGPGPIEIAGTRTETAQLHEMTAKAIPLARWDRPEDIATLVVFMVNDCGLHNRPVHQIRRWVYAAICDRHAGALG